MKSLAAEGPETPKTASKIHRKLQGRQSGGVVWGLFGGESAEGGAAPIIFGYHRRPPARTGWPRGRRPDLKAYTPDSRVPAKQRRLAYGVGRLGRDSPRKPRED